MKGLAPVWIGARSWNFGSVFGGESPTARVSEQNHFPLKDGTPRNLGLLKCLHLLCEVRAPRMPADCFPNFLEPQSRTPRASSCPLNAPESLLLSGARVEQRPAHPGPARSNWNPRGPRAPRPQWPLSARLPTVSVENGEVPNLRLESRISVKFVSPASGSPGHSFSSLSKTSSFSIKAQPPGGGQGRTRRCAPSPGRPPWARCLDEGGPGAQRWGSCRRAVSARLGTRCPDPAQSPSLLHYVKAYIPRTKATMERLSWLHKAAQLGVNRFHPRADSPLALGEGARCGWWMKGHSSYLEDEGDHGDQAGRRPAPNYSRRPSRCRHPRSAIGALSQSSHASATFVHFTNNPESH